MTKAARSDRRGGRHRRIARGVAFAVVAAWAIAGCISVDVGGKKGEPGPEERFHALDGADVSVSPGAAAPAVPGATPVAPSAALPAAPRPTIAVRTLRCRDRFGKHVVRRDDAGRITPLDQEIWADEPAQAVTDAVREALATCGTFGAAVDASDAHEAEFVLDGSILEFAIAATEPAPAAPGGTAGATGPVPSKALFRARLNVSDLRTGRVLTTGSYAGEADVPGPGAAGLGPAMGRAVGQALRALLAEIRDLPR